MTANGNEWSHLEETVFQVNDVIRRFWRGGGYDLGRERGEEKGRRIAYLAPAMFDKATRSFNWILAADPVLEAATSDRIDSDKAKSVRAAMAKVLKALAKNLASDRRQSGDGPLAPDGEQSGGQPKLEWEKFENRYSDEPKPFNDYIQLIHENVKHYEAEKWELKESEYLPSVGSVEKVWTAILIAYACYSHPRDQNYEGIFFRILENAGHCHPERINDAVFGVVDNQLLDLTEWKSARKSDFPKCSIQDGNSEQTMSVPDEHGRCYSGSRQAEANILRSAFLSPLLLDWDFRESDDKFLLLAPVYDVWNGTNGWGGLKSVLLIFLPLPSEREANGSIICNPNWQYHYDIMLGRCGELAQEITQADMRRALAKPIEPPYDLVRHFLRILIEVQDWEEAVIFYGNSPEYRFNRVPIRKGKAHKHVREGWAESELSKSKSNGEVWEDNRGSLSGPFEQFNDLHKDEIADEFYMWWTSQDKEGCQDLWSEAVLPGLNPEERAVVSGTSIRFRFPKACRIPPDQETQQLLVDAYRRQQLELMRRLIPKVRARRAALRNAVSAIMGRNMSHNIGSHVLARYAAKVASEAKKPDSPVQIGDSSKKTDPTVDLLGYLQKRMDFLADIGTNDEALTAQPLSLKTQLDRLNFDHECERLAGHPPLLKFIAGSDSVKANVVFKKDTSAPERKDLLFSCPGGEVGVHALYVILENVIRNSARHNTGQGESADSIEIEVRADTPENGFIRLHIRDLQTKLREDGARYSAGGDMGVSWAPISGQALREKVTKAHKEREETQQPEIVPDEINYKFECEEIVDKDGRANSKYWGIREMQICAQYLRQLLLSDLEDVPWSDREPDVKHRPAIQAVREAVDGNNYCLAYIIYLQEAKLLAAIDDGDSSSSETKNGFAKITLSPKGLAGDGKELTAVRDLRNYAFVAYQADGEMETWANRHTDRLPIRRLALPMKSGPHKSHLTWEEMLSWFEEWPNNLTEKMERLNEAYAGILRSPNDKNHLTGLALGCNQSLSQAKLLNADNSPNQPISALDTNTDNILNQCWRNPIYTGLANNTKFKTCFWVDHIGVATLEDFLCWVRANRRLFSMIAWEPCFSDSPCTAELLRLTPGQGWELMASALPRVVVMDERVQAQRNDEHRSIALRRYWEGMQIEVPCCEDDNGKVLCNLENPDLEVCADWLRGLSVQADFLVVHLTVLEKLQSTARDDTSILKKLLDGANVKKDASIIVVTGRGAATFARSNLGDLGSDLAKRIRHLPVSAILEYMIFRPSKLGLMRVLWSASQWGAEIP